MMHWVRKRPRQNKANPPADSSGQGPARVLAPPVGPSVRNKANFRTARSGQGPARRPVPPVGPMARNKANFQDQADAMDLEPASICRSRPWPGGPAGVQWRFYTVSQVPGPPLARAAWRGRPIRRLAFPGTAVTAWQASSRAGGIPECRAWTRAPVPRVCFEGS